MNKQLVATVVGLVLAGSAITASADQGDREKLAACKSSISEALGTETHSRLFGIQNRRSGDRMRLRVYPAEGQSQIVNCWVDKEGGINLQTPDGIALTAPAFDGSERVSLTD